MGFNIDLSISFYLKNELSYCNNGKCKDVRSGKEQHIHRGSIGSLSSEMDDFIIEQTKERLTQELNNLSADEMKANVVVGVSVIFAILGVSQYLQIYEDINSALVGYTVILFTITLITLLFSFFHALKVLYPRKKRFDLWNPRESNNDYSIRAVNATMSQVKKDYKEEIIKNYETILDAREKDAGHLKWGYIFLIIGSISIFITLFVSKSYGIN